MLCSLLVDAILFTHEASQAISLYNLSITTNYHTLLIVISRLVFLEINLHYYNKQP
uniref:Uncharacterized protein n=1 Tax=Arundo donax TaxID=35708 RepID=A0A0A9BW06_ARUDO